MKTISLKNKKEVQELPHIGEVRAGLIVAKQNSDNPIKDDLELSKIKGIGNVRGREILKWIDKNNVKIIY